MYNYIYIHTCIHAYSPKHTHTHTHANILKITNSNHITLVVLPDLMHWRIEGGGGQGGLGPPPLKLVKV